jgi:hypothetical protein
MTGRRRIVIDGGLCKHGFAATSVRFHMSGPLGKTASVKYAFQTHHRVLRLYTALMPYLLFYEPGSMQTTQ